MGDTAANEDYLANAKSLPTEHEQPLKQLLSELNDDQQLQINQREGEPEKVDIKQQDDDAKTMSKQLPFKHQWKCSKCYYPIEDYDRIRCVGECKRWYHLGCAGNADKLTLLGRQGWKCNSCTKFCSTPKMLRTNSVDRSMGSGSLHGEQTNPMLGTILEKIEAMANNTTKSLEMFNSKMELLTQHNKIIDNNVEILMSKMDQQLELTTDMVVRLSYLEDAEVKCKLQIETIIEKQTKSDHRIDELNDTLNNFEYYQRKLNIELHGVHEVRGENVEDLILELGKTIGCETDKKYVQAVHRLGLGEDQLALRGIKNKRKGPRIIIIKFVNQKLVSQWMAQRQYLPNSNELIGSGPSHKLFLNLNLPKELNKLFLRARYLKKEMQWTKVWVIRNRLYIRINSGDEALHIQNLSDLDRWEKVKGNFNGGATSKE